MLGWQKETFRGRDAVAAERERGVRRILSGVATAGRQPLRDGGEVVLSGTSVGTLSSGNFSPVLGHGIGMGLLEPDLPVGREVTVVLREKEMPAHITALPFVKKES